MSGIREKFEYSHTNQNGLPFYEQINNVEYKYCGKRRDRELRSMPLLEDLNYITEMARKGHVQGLGYI